MTLWDPITGLQAAPVQLTCIASFRLTQLPSQNDTEKKNKGLLPSLTPLIQNFESSLKKEEKER